MPRTISRSERMNNRVTFRATESDVASMKLAAQKKGVDISTMIRMILIQEKIISPLG